MTVRSSSLWQVQSGIGSALSRARIRVATSASPALGFPTTTHGSSGLTSTLVQRWRRHDQLGRRSCRSPAFVQILVRGPVLLLRPLLRPASPPCVPACCAWWWRATAAGGFTRIAGRGGSGHRRAGRRSPLRLEQPAGGKGGGASARQGGLTLPRERGESPEPPFPAQCRGAARAVGHSGSL